MTASTAHNRTIDQAGMELRAKLCREMALSAGQVAMEGFARRDSSSIGMKGPQDFLTETDSAVERHIKARIAEVFPEDGFLGEETGIGGDVTGNVWVVDPIDGTANFARDIPHFCISIAFVVDGQVVLGAINNPSLNELYFARRGRGAWRNEVQLQVAKTDEYSAACVELGWSNRRPLGTYIDVLTNILERGANVRRSASGALGLAFVADGRSDAYLELHMHAWDCLAGLLLVQEAGGVVVPFLENGGLLNGGPVLAAVPAIAEDLCIASGIAMHVESDRDTAKPRSSVPVAG